MRKKKEQKYMLHFCIPDKQKEEKKFVFILYTPHHTVWLK